MPAAMTAMQWDRGDSSNGKGGGQDSVFTEQNGRQGIRNKEHQAMQKQVECMQWRGFKEGTSTNGNATPSRQGCLAR